PGLGFVARVLRGTFSTQAARHSRSQACRQSRSVLAIRAHPPHTSSGRKPRLRCPQVRRFAACADTRAIETKRPRQSRRRAAPFVVSKSVQERSPATRAAGTCECRRRCICRRSLSVLLVPARSKTRET